MLPRPVKVEEGGTNAITASGARTNLGLGTIATQDANAVSITGGSITGMPLPTLASDVATKDYVDSNIPTLPVSPADGGTGITSYTIGDLIYASGATTLSKLADVATGQVLVSGGVGVAPAYSASPTVTTLTGSTSVLTPLLDTASAAALNIGTTSATSIVLQKNVTLANSRTFTAASSGNYSWSGASGSTFTIAGSNANLSITTTSGGTATFGGGTQTIISNNGSNRLVIGANISVAGVEFTGSSTATFNWSPSTQDFTTATGIFTYAGASTKTFNVTTTNANINLATTTSGSILLNASTNVTLQTASTNRLTINNTGTMTLAAALAVTTSAGAGSMTLSNWTGDFAFPTGAINWAGASGKAVSLVANTAAITITAGASSTFSTSSGSFNLSGASGVNLQQSGISYVSVSSTDLQLGSGVDLSAVGGVSNISFGASTGAATMPTGTFSWSGASGSNFTVTALGAGIVTFNSAGGIRFLGTAPAAAADTVGYGIVDINGATTAALFEVYEGGATKTERVEGSTGAIKIMHIARDFTDDESLALPTPSAGKVGTLDIYSPTNAAYGTVVIIEDGSVINTINIGANFSNADTDTRLCVFENTGVATLRNRLGTTQFLVGTYRWQ